MDSQNLFSSQGAEAAKEGHELRHNHRNEQKITQIAGELEVRSAHDPKQALSWLVRLLRGR